MRTDADQLDTTATCDLVDNPPGGSTIRITKGAMERIDEPDAHFTSSRAATSSSWLRGSRRG